MVESWRKTACGATAVFLMLALHACRFPAARGQNLHRFERRAVAMGVECRMVVFAPGEAEAARAFDAAMASIVDDDARFSDYRVEGELARVEARAGRGAVKVSREFLELTAAAIEISSASDGAFDISVGPLTRLWREARATGVKPTEAAIAGARASIGWRGIAVDEAGSQVTLTKEGMRLDFGGIAKGYACERAVRAMERLGFERCLVSLAGDLTVGAPPPGEAGWRIAIAPRGGEPEGTLTLSRASVSTSGDAEQYFELDGERSSHIVNPLTGFGVAAGPPVTVVASTGAIADGLATAIAVVGRAGAPKLVAAFPEARVRIGSGADATAIPDFPKLAPLPAAHGK